jgi:hypothetical protein
MRLALPLLLLSCTDHGIEKLNEAKAAYSALVDQGVRTDDPRYAKVLEQLDAVPAGSSAKPRAEALARSLRNAQAPRVRTPLAIQGGEHLPAEVAAQLAKCRALAEQLGALPEADRPGKLKELDACRAAAEKLDEASRDAPSAGPLTGPPPKLAPPGSDAARTP